jgi:2-haloacid dehalogenase
VAVAWRARYQPQLETVRSGAREWVNLDVLHREALDDVLAELELDLDPAARDELTLAWHRLDPWPDAVAGLARLKTRFIIAPLSNGNIILMLDMAKRAGLPWDAILGAELAQAYKPAPEVYLRSADALGLEPGEVMMVAAHNADLAAARELGFATGFVLRPGEDDEPTSDWDVVAWDFLELSQALRRRSR